MNEKVEIKEFSSKEILSKEELAEIRFRSIMEAFFGLIKPEKKEQDANP